MIRTGHRADSGSLQPHSNLVTLRAAQVGDTPALSEIEREAFPTQWPPTRFRRELERTRSSYLVTELPRSPDFDEGFIDWHNDTGGEEGAEAGLGRWFRSLRGLAFANRDESDEEAEQRERVVGYVGTWFMAGEAHIVAIAVRQAHRHRGIGELLLIGALAEAQRRECTVATLEVRESNWSARRLYLKCGFEEAGVRKRYYMDNGEDAVIMTTPPVLSPEFVRSLARLERHHQDRWGYESTLAR